MSADLERAGTTLWDSVVGIASKDAYRITMPHPFVQRVGFLGAVRRCRAK